jgi:hypothetical protein
MSSFPAVEQNNQLLLNVGSAAVKPTSRLVTYTTAALLIIASRRIIEVPSGACVSARIGADAQAGP